MKTLELKHLAPYLPYALGFLHRDEIYQLMKLSMPYDQNPMWIEGWNGTDMISVFPEGCEPLLRPLSDLTKRIQHPASDYTFIPMDMFARSTHDTVKKCAEMKEVELLEYYLIEYLFEWHFDVFGLIDKGLAIDINTITNDNN